MTVAVAIAVSVLPVFLFLGSLVLIDSFPLVPLRTILPSVAAGAVDPRKALLIMPLAKDEAEALLVGAALFAIVFAILGAALTLLAMQVVTLPLAVSGGIAAGCFFGGYLLQFIGHAVEKSMPVLVKHPIQANLAAPFFTIVEIFCLLGLRKELFDEVNELVASRRSAEAAAAS